MGGCCRILNTRVNASWRLITDWVISANCNPKSGWISGIYQHLEARRARKTLYLKAGLLLFTWDSIPATYIVLILLTEALDGDECEKKRRRCFCRCCHTEYRWKGCRVHQPESRIFHRSFFFTPLWGSLKTYSVSHPGSTRIRDACEKTQLKKKCIWHYN